MRKGEADEWQLLDALEPEAEKGGCIIDWHACELFPKRWIDLVVVLRVDSTMLYDRLKARHVPPNLTHPHTPVLGDGQAPPSKGQCLLTR